MYWYFAFFYKLQVQPSKLSSKSWLSKCSFKTLNWLPREVWKVKLVGTSQSAITIWPRNCVICLFEEEESEDKLETSADEFWKNCQLGCLIWIYPYGQEYIIILFIFLKEKAPPLSSFYFADDGLWLQS